MTSTWTQESVLRLAPDAGSAKSGKDLASARKWVSFNQDSASIWGLCQGSGSKPYQTIVDLSEPAFKCSCPSRKFPCKHGLGLLLMFAADQAAFPTADAPAWVSEWLSSRAQRAEKKAQAAAKPPDPVDVEAQAERRQKRVERIVDGLSSLRTWVDDLIRQGITTAPSRGYSFFDEPARRMIDAQAPGVARMVQGLAATASSGAGWHAAFLRQLGSLHLLLRAAERLDQLPPETRDDVMAAIGVPVPQEEVLARAGVSETRQIIAQEVVFEDKLRVQRTWLFGIASKRPVLVLHFAHGTGPLDASFVVGMKFQGEVCDFPGNGVRGVVKTRQPSEAIETLVGYESLDELCDAYGAMLARQPWLGGIVMPVRQMAIVYGEGKWSFVDGSGSSLPGRMSAGAAWQTMAASGGHPIDVASLFDGEAITPLAVASEGQTISITTSNAGAELVG